MTGIDTENWHELAENRAGLRQVVEKGVQSFEAERLKARAVKWQQRKTKEALTKCLKSAINVQQNLVLNLYVRRVVESANQELASTAATPESIHNNTDIIEIDEFTTSSSGSIFIFCSKCCILNLFISPFYSV